MQRIYWYTVVSLLAHSLTACTPIPSFKSQVPGRDAAAVARASSRTPSLETLVERGELDAAAALYLKNESRFAKKQSLQPTIARLAEGLRAQYAGGAAALAARLDGMPAAPERARWAEIKQDLVSARKMIARYHAQPIFTRPDFASPDIAALEASLRSRENALTASAAELFARFDHGATPLFADQYPVALDAAALSALARDHAQAWMGAVAGAREPDARALVAAYGPAIADPAMRRALARAYATSFIRSKGEWRQPYSALQMVSIERAARKAVPDSGYVPARIAVVTLGDGSRAPGWDPRALGYPTFEVARHALVASLQELAAKQGFTHVIVADTAREAVVDRVLEVRQRSSERVTGYRDEPNPEYQEAQRELEALAPQLREQEANVAAAKNEYEQMLAQGHSTTAALMAGLVLAQQTLLSKLQSQESQARELVSSAPRTVRKPQTAPYSYTEMRVERALLREVGIYAVDTGRKDFQRMAIATQARHENIVAFNLDPSDRTHAARAQERQAAMEAFRKVEAAPIEMDRVLAALVEQAPSLGTEPLARIAAAVQEDRGRFQSARQREQQEGQASLARAKQALAR